MNSKNKNILILIIGLIIGAFAMHLFKTYKIEKRSEAPNAVSVNSEFKDENSRTSFNENGKDISELTNETMVINYVKSHHELPDYYITKAEARQQGWQPSQGNLCDVLPGKAIGGDHFSNREKKFPKGEQYFEADVNYNCGNRGADRIVFTKNGDVWLTHDHYKTFEKQ